jgi:flagellar basal-body rod modification protein FlgD
MPTINTTATGNAGFPCYSSQPAGGALDRDAFLQLLVTQLANQDPTSPQDSSEFAAQLAQFSSIEQLTNISETLTMQSDMLYAMAGGLSESATQQSELATMLTSRSDLATATGMIGQTVEATGNKIQWDGSTPGQFGYTLSEPAASVKVEVRDAAGHVVRTLDLGHAGTGPGAGTWDGLDAGGQPVPPGTYTFRVDARDAAGETVDATTSIRGRVDRITIESGGVKLWIGALSVSLADLRGMTPSP